MCEGESFGVVFISYNLIIYLLFSSPDSHTLPMWRSTQNGEEKDPSVYLDAKHMLVLWLHSRSDRFRFSHLNSVNQRLVLLSVAITEIGWFQSAVCRTISDELIHTDKSCKSHYTRSHSLLHPPPKWAVDDGIDWQTNRSHRYDRTISFTLINFVIKQRTSALLSSVHWWEK